MKNLKKSVLCMLMAVIMVMTVTAASVIPVQDVYAASVKLNKTSLNMYTRTDYDSAYCIKYRSKSQMVIKQTEGCKRDK